MSASALTRYGETNLARISGEVWAVQDSNLWQPACKAGALPTELTAPTCATAGPSSARPKLDYRPQTRLRASVATKHAQSSPRGWPFFSSSTLHTKRIEPKPERRGLA
jgi:hypothetical protein